MPKGQILVVDDESIIAENIKDRLNSLGYNIAVAYSGKEAIQKVKETIPDLILMDIILGGDIDGVETANHIRKHFDIPIIYLTGCADDKVLQRAKITGPFGYILKPFKIKELHTAIEVALYKHEMDRKLKENEQWLDTILKSMGDGVIVTDVKGIVTYINPVAETLTGWKYKDIQEKELITIFKVINEETRAPVEFQVKKILHNDPIICQEHNLILISNEGKETFIDSHFSQLKDEKGNIIGIVIIFRNINKEKNLKEQLLRAQKMEAIGKLSGGIAHDFNNLLTVINGNSDVIVNELGKDNPIGKIAEEINLVGQHAANLTHQLLTFSRRQTMNPKIFNLNSILPNLEKMLRRIVSEDIDLVINLENELEMIKSDPGQIEQAIINLVINARDAMPNGGRIIIETANIELDEDYCSSHIWAKPGRYVMLSVSDTGIGMSPEVKERIFDPFFTTKDIGKGTGLGLSTVYGIVKQSHGNIWVYSEDGMGTTFKIYLPCIDESSNILPTSDKMKALPMGRGKILVVEDQDMVRNFIIRSLKKNGYSVLQARNGDDALVEFKYYNKDIDLLLTDVVMPGMSGPELARRLCRMIPKLKVLYMSGYSDDVVVSHGISDQISNFIEKPLNRYDLLTTVARVLATPCVSTNGQEPKDPFAKQEIARKVILVSSGKDELRKMLTEELQLLGHTVFATNTGKESFMEYKVLSDVIDVAFIEWSLPDMSGQDCAKEMLQINPNVFVAYLCNFLPTNEQRIPSTASILQIPFTRREIEKLLSNT